MSRNRRAAVLLAVCLSGFGYPAQAIVSMESLHLRTPEEGLGAEVEISWTGSTGNTEKSDLAAGTRLDWRHGAHTDFAVASYARGEVNDVENTNRSFLHVRHIYQQDSLLAWEGFGQAEQNEFARLSFRGILGAGARFTLLEPDQRHAALFGVGAMYIRETYTELAGLTGDASERLWRANLYLVLKYQIRDGLRLVNTIYYQPALREISDYRLLDNFALHVDLTDRLTLRIGIDVTHDSTPPATVKETDVIYRTGLGWKF